MSGVLATAALGAGLVVEVLEHAHQHDVVDDILGRTPLRQGPGAVVPSLAVRARRSSNQPPTDPDLPLRELLAGWLAPLPARERNAVVSTLAGSTACAGEDPPSLSRVLHGIRQALRERLPAPAHPLRAPHASAVLRLTDRHVHLVMRLPEPGSIAAVVAVSPEGHRVRLPTTGDGDLVACCRLESPTHLTAGWLVECELQDGSSCELTAPGVTVDPLEVADTLIEQWTFEERRPCTPDPAVWEELRRLLWTGAHVVIDRVYGVPPLKPRASTVVLLGDVDEAEHHVLPLSADPEEELIFLLGGGRPVQPALAELEALQALYQVPFRVLVPDRRVDIDLGTWLAERHARAYLQRIIPPAGGECPAAVTNGGPTSGTAVAGSIASSTTSRGEKHGFL